MPYRSTPLVNENTYHVYNRGVERRLIFSNDRDYQRLLQTLYYYQFEGPKPAFSTHHRFKIKDFSHNPKIVEIQCYCLMPNHFHLIIRQVKENGISEYMRKVVDSYAKYYNTKNRRVGPLFQSVFKAVLVEDDNQLLHLSRYIHLNPFVGNIVSNLEFYQYSSYRYYIGLSSDHLCITDTVLSNFMRRNDYKEFVEGHGDYARELEIMKHLLFEEE